MKSYLSTAAFAAMISTGVACDDMSARHHEPAQSLEGAKAASKGAPAKASKSQPEALQPVALREDPGAEDSPEVQTAVAALNPTEGSSAKGIVQFTKTVEGLEVSAELTGLPPGKHAYHVHLYGDCSSPDGKSAGTHFNFLGSSKEPGKVSRITGNLGELQADDTGKAFAKRTISNASLAGQYSILGRSVVVHAKGNDPKSPPIGAAGARLACGVIGVDAKGD